MGRIGRFRQSAQGYSDAAGSKIVEGRRRPVRPPEDAVLGGRESGEDALMTKLVAKGSRHGSTWVGRVGDVTKRPPVWMGIATALALTGPRGRQAAVRGSASYVAGTVAHLAVKVVVKRSRPPRASRHTSIGPVTSSFPSGHCASELAFSLGAAQEIPWLFVPLYGATLAGEWSLLRSRAHYPSDIFAGAAISIVVALVATRLWPSHRASQEQDDAIAQGQESPVQSVDPVAPVQSVYPVAPSQS